MATGTLRLSLLQAHVQEQSSQISETEKKGIAA
jgi:hypothetical protein